MEICLAAFHHALTWMIWPVQEVNAVFPRPKIYLGDMRGGGGKAVGCILCGKNAGTALLFAAIFYLPATCICCPVVPQKNINAKFTEPSCTNTGNFTLSKAVLRLRHFDAAPAPTPYLMLTSYIVHNSKIYTFFGTVCCTAPDSGLRKENFVAPVPQYWHKVLVQSR
jgi:hypothetical protein